MVIVGITDIHGNVKSVQLLAKALEAADVVVLAGDLTTYGSAKDAENVVQAVREHCPVVVAVPGNCDGPEVVAQLASMSAAGRQPPIRPVGGASVGLSLHGANATLNGAVFLGLGGSLPCLGRTPNEYTEEELEAFLSKSLEGVDAALPKILVSHQPPRKTAVDIARAGGHVGSESVRRFIETVQPVVCFTGHIHESRGIDCLGMTKIVNPGPAREGHYAYAVVTDTLEILEIRS